MAGSESGIVAITSLLDVFITSIELSPSKSQLVIYARVPSGDTAASIGEGISIDAAMVSDEVSITETPPESPVADGTYAFTANALTGHARANVTTSGLQTFRKRLIGKQLSIEVPSSARS
jgi:hypothetical protein